MKKYVYLVVCALAATMISCGGGNEFKVEGNIAEAGDSTVMVLESAGNGNWYFVDSVKVNAKGDFAVKAPAPITPGIYRLRLGSESVYFPIDSIDRITLTSSRGKFATEYTLAGSDAAVEVMNIDKKAMQMAKSGDQAAIEAWKKQLANQILTNPSGIVAYYVINKYIGDEPLFDALNDNDLKIIGAVANAYNTFRPNDPRTSYLVKVLLDGQRRRRDAQGTLPSRQIMAEEIPIIDIDLQDNHGKQCKLSEVTKQGKVVVLNFTMYQADFSPMFNKTLADVYHKYSSQGLEIYQVSVDPDEFQWRQSAANLPWITVYDPMSIQSRNLTAYNVIGVPTSFVISREGEVVERVEDATKLASAVAKHILKRAPKGFF
ncbi:MAG: redoxin domain-containing protein [Muribaculaceae bacterium]